MRQPIAAVMVHVPDVPEALDWYEKAFPNALRTTIQGPDFDFLMINGVQLELVPSDEKVSSGAAGSVVYWAVEDFDASLQHFKSIGAVLYRGPLKIEGNASICQVRDPWGNCIGLRGHHSLSKLRGT
jgi:predicted enzyme related to lactoylglutathione lyase